MLPGPPAVNSITGFWFLSNTMPLIHRDISMWFSPHLITGSHNQFKEYNMHFLPPYLHGALCMQKIHNLYRLWHPDLISGYEKKKKKKTTFVYSGDKYKLLLFIYQMSESLTKMKLTETDLVTYLGPTINVLGGLLRLLLTELVWVCTPVYVCVPHPPPWTSSELTSCSRGNVTLWWRCQSHTAW